MPGVLFLDLARKTGVAHDGPDPGRPITRLLTLPKVDDDGGGKEYGPLFGTFRREVVALIQVVKPEILGFEAAINVMGVGGPVQRHQTNISTVRVLYGLAAFAEEIAWAHSLRCYEVNIATIKKHATGSGRAEKSDVKRAIASFGIDHGGDDNRADAAAGWLYLKALSDKSFRPGAGTPLFAKA